MIAAISAALSVRPWILARTASRLLGGVAGVTVTSAAGRFGKAAEGRLGQPDLIGADQAVIGEQQRRQQDLGIAAQFDAAEAAEHFRPQRRWNGAKSPPRFRGRYRD